MYLNLALSSRGSCRGTSKLSLLLLLLSSKRYSMAAVTPVLVVQGGAGDIPDSNVASKLAGVKLAAMVGYRVLHQTGNVLDAIEAAIHVMEDDEAFNAGKGSVLNLNGEIEMEALITEGKHMRSGAVTLVRNVAHPISLARMVMEKTPHAMLGGAGLQQFVDRQGLDTVSAYSLVTQSAIDSLERFIKRGGPPSDTELGRSGVGTVGCVAVDSSGHVASGTSTGGMTGKYKGRIGDTPLVGCGGYSDDEVGAVSTTGHGESIMRYNLAHRILSAIEYGKDVSRATEESCSNMTRRVGRNAGAVTVTNKGQVGVGFSTKRMAWAYQLEGQVHYGIDPGQHLVEKVSSL